MRYASAITRLVRIERELEELPDELWDYSTSGHRITWWFLKLIGKEARSGSR